MKYTMSAVALGKLPLIEGIDGAYTVREADKRLMMSERHVKRLKRRRPWWSNAAYGLGMSSHRMLTGYIYLVKPIFPYHELSAFPRSILKRIALCLYSRHPSAYKKGRAHLSRGEREEIAAGLEQGQALLSGFTWHPVW
ncbi:MAG: hypothetical protein LBK73_12865 [Treponema sp.]|jgi:hypothetical protein|nr:hypothetical protein [Treponema sp.]